MQFIEHGVFQRDSFPSGIVPIKSSYIDYLGRAVNAIRLIARCWIGALRGSIEAVVILRASETLGDAGAVVA